MIDPSNTPIEPPYDYVGLRIGDVWERDGVKLIVAALSQTQRIGANAVGPAKPLGTLVR